ncbi:hypothetical protein TCAL_16060 [Tigriopus californicus]|uniref:Ionotropic glutamate receptor C-terminal domain-containing protein n=1 Tax=Tigriopus californicus TaxID=6832 RepID=A0A553PNY6_TIGCA|nr:hypothetical protein TCAL_16060 [Tigriopus californicus]
MFQIFRGELQGAIPGLLAYQNNKVFDLSNYLLFSQLRYVTRVPTKTVSFGNVVKGFDMFSWIAMFIALTCFSVTFQTMFHVYKFELKDKALYNNPGNPVDFFLLTFSTFVEPHKINWFPSWSAGKMLALLLSVFALLMFEVSPAFERVLDRVEEMGGWYSSVQEDGILEPKVEAAVLNKGDVYISIGENVLYSYLFQKTLGFPNLRISNDGLYNFYTSLRIKKYSPYTPDINHLFTMYQEVGIFKKFLNKPIPIIALPSTSIGSQPESSENLRMSMEMLWTPIILLASGTFVGGIALLFEIVMAGHKKMVSRI